MIKIEVDEKVRRKLRRTFTSPPNAGDKALDKYVALLESLLTESTLFNRSKFMTNSGIYIISLKTLHERGPRIGASKERLHKWLSDNKLALVKEIEKGSNLTGLVSLVKLTNLVTAKDIYEIQASRTSSYQFKNKNEDESNDAIKKIISQKYGDFSLEKWNAGGLRNEYDVIKVNIDSVESYITWVLKKSYKVSLTKRQKYASQARYLLLIARYFNGIWPQKKIKSAFGRTYYAGLSIQNVNKTLRQAILAPGYEYDVNTSVCAIKLNLAIVCSDRLEKDQDKKITRENISKVLRSIYSYVQSKKEFINEIRMNVYIDTDKSEHERQRKIIKQALTSISFGATLNSTGWTDNNGNYQNPAIKLIFGSDSESCERFMKNRYIVEFVNEHKVIDEMLKKIFVDNYPNYKKDQKFVLTERGKLSKSKVSSFFYQKFETVLMNKVREFLVSNNYEIKANIHDAVVLNRKLGADNKFDLTYHIENEGDNCWDFIKFGETELKVFSEPSQAELDNIEEEERMIQIATERI